MRIVLNQSEIEYLQSEKIAIDINKEYTEYEALNLLDAVRDVQIGYSQCPEKEKSELHDVYMRIADKIFDQIPE